MKINYPKDFVERVKKALPQETDLHKHLDQGDEIVGRYLDDMSSHITVNKVKDELYGEWLEFRRASKPIPQDFIERVKKVYPKAKSLHESLVQGKDIAGRMLDDMRYEEHNDRKLTTLYIEWQTMYRKMLRQKGLLK